MTGQPSRASGAVTGKMPANRARCMTWEAARRHQLRVLRAPRWNFVAMGQVGLTGWVRVAAQAVARAVARRIGRPEAQICL